MMIVNYQSRCVEIHVQWCQQKWIALIVDVKKKIIIHHIQKRYNIMITVQFRSCISDVCLCGIIIFGNKFLDELKQLLFRMNEFRRKP